MNRLAYASALLVVLFGVHCSSDDGCSGSSDEPKDETADESAKANELKGPSDFASMESDEARARAIFAEMGRVLTHPRCVNCHPTGDEPLQGAKSRPHQPMVKPGPGGMGKTGMRCNTCHGTNNYRNVPGKPGWRAAPESLGWEGMTTAEICELLTDPERSGTTVEQAVSFMANNPLAAYGWETPEQYETAPGTHERFGKLAEAWAEAGAHCPNSSDHQ